MTVPHTGPPVDAVDVDAALAVLKERGLRVSVSRRLVLEALFVAGGPVTAESIARGLEGHVTPTDLASVYRNLETLEQVGLVRHLHLGHGPSRYVLAGAGEREYLVCECCGAVRGVPSKQLDGVRRTLASRFGWTVTFAHSPIVGRCADCS